MPFLRGLVPGFIAQYRQRSGGRLDQGKLDLAPRQHIADQYHHGDNQQLIQYRVASRDLTLTTDWEFAWAAVPAYAAPAPSVVWQRA